MTTAAPPAWLDPAEPINWPETMANQLRAVHASRDFLARHQWQRALRATLARANQARAASTAAPMGAVRRHDAPVVDLAAYRDALERRVELWRAAAYRAAELDEGAAEQPEGR